MVLNDFLHIGQPQTKTFHIVAVSGMNPVELIEYLLQILLLDANTIVLNGNIKLVRFVPGLDMQPQFAFRLLVFHRIVQQVENDIGEMHFIHKYPRTMGIQLGSDGTVVLLGLQRKGIHHTGYQIVGIDILHLQSSLLPLEHGHLQHLLYLEA